jgi:hypothetical protein
MKYIKYLNSPTLLILIISFLFYLFLFATMPNGPGLSPDSLGYLKASMGLINGKGFEYFTSQWPPLYPILIGLISTIFDIKVLKGAQVLQAVLGAMVFIITTLLIIRIIRIKEYLLVLMAAVICLQGPITYIEYYVWSELLFIFLILCDDSFFQSSIDKLKSFKYSLMAFK